MHFSRCQRVFIRAAALALALGATAASAAVAKPKPGKPGGFRLFASAITVLQINRVQCRVASDGSVCATGSSTVGGGIWPRGTADQYVFGSGINIGGIIEAGDRSVNGFAGDTAGAFFNNTAGSSNGEEVRQVFNSADAGDAANWPDEARVPCSAAATSGPCVDLALGTDPQGDLFAPALQGAIAASQGDAWFLSWEGNPGRLESRAHPLGILVETRAIGWNFPTGNEDILYFFYTFYNITSTDPADYAAIRPSMRAILLERAAAFQALNTATFGINLPAGGYTINDFYAAYVADMDVAVASANYASVNVPFQMGYTYEHAFDEAGARAIGWTFDPAIFGSAPFFNGPGFVGVKYLGSPVDPATGNPVGLTLFGTFSNSTGSVQDPNDEKQLYRFLTGGLLPTDGACSLPNPIASKICYVNIGSPADMRFFQSSGPVDLPPGGSGTITVAYIFAAPVSAGGCPGAGCDVKPANSTADLDILGDPARMASGVNTIDSVTGYLGFNNAGPTDTDPTTVSQGEFIVQPGSLLGKANVAQIIFDGKFVLPFAPERPEFFLVPGNNQVTVLWARSATETTPDPFFALASQPTIDGNPNTLYDPNFRGNDVEGYRIYRGRTDSPSELQLIAQFDFAPSADGKGIFRDFRGSVNPTNQCAPELGVTLACPVVFSSPTPGNPFIGSTDVDLVGTFTQIIPGERVLLASGEAQALPGSVDTAFADINTGRIAQGVSTQLTNSGVPFLFIDRNVRNSLRYFYSVVAFDVNSLASGNSSLESSRATKAVTPVPAASNQQVTSNLVTHVIGRGVAMDTVIDAPPTLDAATGRFSGPAQPSDGGVVGFVGEFAAAVIQPSQAGALTMRLDSLHMGVYSGIGNVFGVVSGATIPAEYYATVANGVDSFQVLIALNPTQFGGNSAVGASNEGIDSASAFFEALTVDPTTAANFEGAPPFRLQGQATVRLPPGQYNGGWGVGSRFGDFGTPTTSIYNGARWFDGPSPATNETVADPNLNNCVANAGGSTALLTAVECGAAFTNYNNAGGLTGVTTINQAHAYIGLNGQWRNLDWIFPTAHRAADMNVYWGAGGAVDSVIDVSHNVVVPFQPYMGGGWGILNTVAGSDVDTRPTVGTVVDIGCVEPFATGNLAVEASLRIPCTSGVPVALSSTAQLGAVAFIRNVPDAPLNPPDANPGFIFYVAGSVFTMAMPALPAAGTVWALRSYAGQIIGTPGAYEFTPPPVRPFTALGATAALEFGVSSVVAAAVNSDLTNVHTVPDPYYVRSAYEASTDQKVLKFVGLPQDAIVRIYSASGVLVRMLEHRGGQYSSTSASQGSEVNWDLRNRNNQVVASGVYFYHVEAGDARRVGRFTVVNFAQ